MTGILGFLAAVGLTDDATTGADVVRAGNPVCAGELRTVATDVNDSALVTDNCAVSVVAVVVIVTTAVDVIIGDADSFAAAFCCLLRLDLR